MSFAQGAPTQPLVLLGSNVFLYGSSTSGNAFTVQQLSSGNVFSAQTSTGATALIVNPSGNVGIGTASPQSPMHIYKSGGVTSVQGEIRVCSDDGNKSRVGMYEESAGSTWGAWMQYNGSGDTLEFGAKRNGTDTLPQMAITSTGNVGIGRTDPLYRFNVDNGSTVGPVAFAQASGITAGQNMSFILGKVNSTSNAGTILWNHVGDSLATNYLGLGFWGGDNKLVVTASSNVGIGITNPGTALQVVGTVTATSLVGTHYGALAGANTASSSNILVASGLPASIFQGSNVAVFSNASGGSNVMVMNSLGQVGIGITNPGTALQVVGTVTATTFSGSAASLTSFPNLNQNTTGSAASLSGAPSTSVSPLYILGAAAAPSWDTLSDAAQRSNTYIAFNEAGSGNDWAYLRQIGGSNAYEMAFDFHDDGNDCRMSWRDITSTAAPDTVVTRMRLNGGALFVSGDITAFNNFSDARLKEDVVNIENCLDKVQELRPVEFTWKQDIRNNTKRGKRDVGLIAQEAFKVFPLAHNIIQDPDTNEDIHTLKYERFVPLLIGALKEEKAKRESLELRLERLEKLLGQQ